MQNIKLWSPDEPTICVELLQGSQAARPPRWHDEDDEKGVLKILMTGYAIDEVDRQAVTCGQAPAESPARRFNDSSQANDGDMV